MQKFDIDTWLL